MALTLLMVLEEMILLILVLVTILLVVAQEMTASVVVGEMTGLMVDLALIRQIMGVQQLMSVSI